MSAVGRHNRERVSGSCRAGCWSCRDSWWEGWARLSSSSAGSWRGTRCPRKFSANQKLGSRLGNLEGRRQVCLPGARGSWVILAVIGGGWRCEDRWWGTCPGSWWCWGWWATAGRSSLRVTSPSWSVGGCRGRTRPPGRGYCWTSPTSTILEGCHFKRRSGSAVVLQENKDYNSWPILGISRRW